MTCLSQESAPTAGERRAEEKADDDEGDPGGLPGDGLVEAIPQPGEGGNPLLGLPAPPAVCALLLIFFRRALAPSHGPSLAHKHLA